MNKKRLTELAGPAVAGVVIAGSLTLAFTAGGSSTVGSSAAQAASGAGPIALTSASTINKKALPLGDGKVSTTKARKGWIYSCSAGDPNGPGSPTNGPWINESNNTYDLTKKAIVDGTVSWNNARFSKKKKGKKRTFSGNGLPTNRTTGKFPVQNTDDAYTYDPNPNTIKEQAFSLVISSKPKIAKTPSCLNGGTIGVALNGVPIFNGLDAKNRDAVAHEVQDACQGHPQMQGQYHYHSLAQCFSTGESTKKQSKLLGFAIDGFPIYGPRGKGGHLITNKQLDACHGTVSKVKLDGRKQKVYHYVATFQYPYTLGCFKGTPVS